MKIHTHPDVVIFTIDKGEYKSEKPSNAIYIMNIDTHLERVTNSRYIVSSTLLEESGL